MMEKEWFLEFDDEIVLYGFNEYCRNQVDKLIAQGYHVRAILDQNAKEEGQYKGVDILRYVSELDVSEKTCVFIMLQNGMLHWDIALTIYRQGVNRVCFLPMRSQSYSNNVHNQFIEQYNYMFEGSYSLLKVPYLTEELFKEMDVKSFRIAKRLDNGESIVWLPVHMVRTAMREPEPYRDIPIVDFTPYFNLFLYLSGGINDISEYIAIYGKIPDSMGIKQAIRYVHEKRQVLYDFFENNFNAGNMEYFTVAAPKATWNNRGYVNLCEGQHRCVYLVFKGMRQVPVRVTQETIKQLSICC